MFNDNLTTNRRVDMKNFSVISAVALALTAPGIAQAATPDGNHTFSGTLQVRKNIPSWSSCTVTAVVRVTGGVPVLQSAVVTGAGACGYISFSGLPSGAVTVHPTLGLPWYQVPNVRVNIAAIPLLAPADACEGKFDFVWGGNGATPRTITFIDGGPTGGANSNILDTTPDNLGATKNDCRIDGTLTQTSSPALSL